jgi:hypothetical protein
LKCEPFSFPGSRASQASQAEPFPIADYRMKVPLMLYVLDKHALAEGLAKFRCERETRREGEVPLRCAGVLADGSFELSLLVDEPLGALVFGRGALQAGNRVAKPTEQRREPSVVGRRRARAR